MSHEFISYGVIVGATPRPEAEFRSLQALNEEVIRNLPEDPDWPWLDRSIFSLPGPAPRGTFRRQIIHFGLSMKDAPENYVPGFYYQKFFNEWIGKFESALRSLFWSSARLHIETDFEPRKEMTWIPTLTSMEEMLSEDPKPISAWTRTEQTIPGEKLAGT